MSALPENNQPPLSVSAKEAFLSFG